VNRVAAAACAIGPRTDLEELFGVRALLEGYAARLAATRYGREQEKPFARVIAKMERAAAGSDYGRMIDLDLEFHLLLWKCAGNRLLLHVLEGLSQQFRPVSHAELEISRRA
jgi:DNA-binding GntR family transcriptional regulator